MANLRPAVLDDFGIAMAIRKEVEEFDRECVHAGFLNGIADMRLHPDIETAFFRVFQEALRNVGRHARAGRADVSLDFTPQRMTLTIRDDGVGFDPAGAAALALGGHYGLLGARERAEAVGARLVVESAVGQGTKIVMTSDE